MSRVAFRCPSTLEPNGLPPLWGGYRWPKRRVERRGMQGEAGEVAGGEEVGLADSFHLPLGRAHGLLERQCRNEIGQRRADLDPYRVLSCVYALEVHSRSLIWPYIIGCDLPVLAFRQQQMFVPYPHAGSPRRAATIDYPDHDQDRKRLRSYTDSPGHILMPIFHWGCHFNSLAESVIPCNGIMPIYGFVTWGD